MPINASGVDRAASFALDGRVLFLCADAARIRRQLAGADLDRVGAGALRHEISTDEIIPTRHCLHVDQLLGRYPHTGLTCDGETPVAPGAIRDGGFRVLVAGRRYGKGSSREAAPLAERHAGIELVVAESFERIYRENAHNVGLLTTTDFNLLEQLLAGHAVPLDAFVRDSDPLTRIVVRAGGLLACGERLAQAAAALPHAASQPMCLGYKIFARAAGRLSVGAGDTLMVEPDWRFAYDLSTAMAAAMLEERFGADVKLADPHSVLLFQDHLALMHRAPLRGGVGHAAAAAVLLKAQRDFAARHGIGVHDGGIDGGTEGICHAVIAERYARPGDLIAGTDSHTPHAGALGALAFGVGSTAMAHALITRQLRVSVPPASRVRVLGRLPAGVAAKDLVLHLLRLPLLRQGGLIGHLVHLQGEGVAALDTDERATITNMAAEMGAFSALIAPDAETVRFVRQRRQAQAKLEAWMQDDAGCAWVHDLEIDASALGPMVAAPGDPGLGITLEEAGRVPIDIAYGGSCTGGKLADWARYHEVLAWGLERGMRVAPGVRLVLQYGSADVERRCVEAGWVTVFEAVGAEILPAGCGACIDAGPGASMSVDDVTVSAQNRNFPGRSGPGRIWLAAPATVAASALAGHLASFAALRHANT